MYSRNVMVLLMLVGLLIPSGKPAAGELGRQYRQRRQAIVGRDAPNRLVPTIPPKEQRIRVIIDTDAKNEIDDIWAIALAIVSPARFAIEGFVASNFDNERPEAGPESVEASAREIETILAKAGLAGRYPIKRGSPPMRYQYEPSESEGVDFIIERAMASTPQDPLWIVGLGSATNLASAYLKEPRIADRIRVFWHFRTRWPEQCWNFNVIGDVRAARLVFHSDLPFVLFDTGTHLSCPMEFSEKFVAGFFDLGDIAALIDPELASWEVVDCPEVNWDLAYRHRKTKGKILRCYDIDREGTMQLLYERLKAFHTRTVPTGHENKVP